MRLLPLAVLLLALPAAADTFVWTDASGEDHYTDDPSTVPPASRRSLRRLDGEETSLSVVNPEDDADTEAAAAERTRLLLEQSERRRAETQRAELEAEVQSLQRQVVDAEREVRRYEAGGRIGAQDAAARAREKVASLRARLAVKERELQILQAR